MNKLPIIIMLAIFTLGSSHNESTVYVTGMGPVLESVDMTMWHCLRRCYFKIVSSVASNCRNSSSFQCLGFHDSYLGSKMHLIVKWGKYSHINLQIHTHMGVIHRHPCIHASYTSTFTNPHADIYKAKRYAKNIWHFLGFWLKQLNSSDHMLALCSTCQFTNDSASRSWKARPKYFQSSKAAKLIRVLHNVKTGMFLSDMFSSYPAVYVVAS